MKSKDKIKLVGFVNSKLNAVRDNGDNYNVHFNDIEVSIGVLQDDDGVESPRNYSPSSYYYLPKNCGGCTGRVYASKPYGNDPVKGSFYSTGPEVKSSSIGEYEHAIHAMKTITKREESFRATRGPAVDAADALGRWLEACGVESVWFRPDDHRAESWLNRGEWKRRSVGEFVQLVRALLPENAKVEATETAVATL